ncbi:nuclear fragile X mental retardation protein interacting protein 1 [Dispira simplex]|nr:nuclear fragile X mental retardation protein interacting protein 1 [Dispira simplex]
MDASTTDHPIDQIPTSVPEPVAEVEVANPSKCSTTASSNANQNHLPATPAEEPARICPIVPTSSPGDTKAHPAEHNKRAKYDIDRQHVIQAFQAPSDDMDFGDLLKSYEKQERKLEKSAKASHPRSKPPPPSPPKSGKSTSKRAKKRPKKKEWNRPPPQESRAPEPTPNSIGPTDQMAGDTTTVASSLLSQNLTNELAMLAVLSATLNGAGANTSLMGGPAAAPSVPFTTPESGSAPPPPTSHPADPRLRLLGESAVHPAPNPVAPLPSMAPMLNPSAAFMQSLGALLPAMSASMPTSVPASAPVPSSAPSKPASAHSKSYARPSPPPRHRNPPNRPPPKKINAVCRYFKTNSCGKGDLCQFSHDLKLEKCRFYLEKGYCRRGNQCPYSHSKV